MHVIIKIFCVSMRLTTSIMLRASCLMLKIKEFRCYETKIEESEKDCESWWLSGCRGSVAEHRWLKPEMSCVRLPATADLFIFLYFRLITSKFLKLLEVQLLSGSCRIKVTL